MNHVFIDSERIFSFLLKFQFKKEEGKLKKKSSKCSYSIMKKATRRVIQYTIVILSLKQLDIWVKCFILDKTIILVIRLSDFINVGSKLNYTNRLFPINEITTWENPIVKIFKKARRQVLAFTQFIFNFSFSFDDEC